MISFKDHQEQICETADTGLAAKASKSGISIGTLRKVYRRGVAAWNSGHRPGTTPQQWGMARVNSYIGKGKGTYGGADKDLHEEQLSESGGEVVWKKNNKHIEKYSDDAFALYVDGKKQKFFTSIEAAKSASDLSEGDTSKLPRVAKDKESGLPKKYVAGLSPSTAKARAAHFAKADKLSDSDPRAYTPAPGDANAKTKPSKHTLKYRAMYGENMDEEILEACWSGYKQVGVKKKGTKMVPNCVPEAANPAQQAAIAIVMKKVGKKPNKNHSSSRLEGTKSLSDIYKKDTPGQNEEVSLAQQAAIVISMKKLVEYAVDSKGHKSSTGGLTQKGRDYFNSKFGGNLRAPVTTPPSKLDPKSKAAKRRKSFCARMSGVKGPMKKPNGEPTRKALALRKWNC
jgi:hypothetical protein